MFKLPCRLTVVPTKRTDVTVAAAFRKNNTQKDREKAVKKRKKIERKRKITK